MKRYDLPVVYLVITLLCFVFFFPGLFFSSPVQSQSLHAVISEIQLSGTSAQDEFIELYNPSENAIDLARWRLSRKTSGGNQINLIASMSGSIPARGYFLVAHPSYDGSQAPDLLYSASSSSVAQNNTVLLYQDAGVTTVDKVGMGEAGDYEASTAANPDTNGSIERKASSASTATSMEPGGAEETAGNGEDTNDNTADFIVRETSDPQNSQSALEPPTLPSSTISPSPTPSASPSPSLTASPLPTASPPPTPSETPPVSATPSLTPTSTPSQATPTPSSTPSPFSPPPFPIPFRFLSITCSVQYHTVSTRWFSITLPRIECTLQRGS